MVYLVIENMRMNSSKGKPVEIPQELKLSNYFKIDFLNS
jgi:hypothetical protein